jgi:lipid II:glycine glycyltransferase (peptidoglycan interpeptide bridge formation enzyme)
MPQLTQKLGILFAPAEVKYAEGIAAQHRLTEELIGRLAPGVTINQGFHENFPGWLPFYWHGYQQTTRYTYILDDLSDTEAVWSRMRSGMRRVVRKAQKGGLHIRDTGDLEYFYRVNMKTFARQGMDPPYSLNLVQRIDDACKRNAGRKMFIAEGADGRAHAGIYIVYDQRSAILLLSGGDEELRSSGAGALLTWEAIRFAATVSKTFDFEGSMIRPIESFYRAFGGRQVPYCRIWGRDGGSTRSRLRNLTGRALRRIARIIDP